MTIYPSCLPSAACDTNGNHLTGMAKLPFLTMNQCRGAIYCAQGRDESHPYGVVNRSLFHVKHFVILLCNLLRTTNPSRPPLFDKNLRAGLSGEGLGSLPDKGELEGVWFSRRPTSYINGKNRGKP